MAVDDLPHGANPAVHLGRVHTTRKTFRIIRQASIVDKIDYASVTGV